MSNLRVYDVAPPLGPAAAKSPDRFGVTPARVRAAELLRQLGHAFVGHDAPDDVFEELRTKLLPIIGQLESGRERDRAAIGMTSGSLMFGATPVDGDRLSHFPDCVVSGSANPMGVAIQVRLQDGEAVAETVLGAAFEGAPGQAHGGVVAAIFDDVMGYQLSIVKVPAFTGRLTVTYRAPTPIGVPLVFRARLDSREERKLHISATATTRDGGALIAEATAVFVIIPIGRFMPGLTEVPE